MATDYWDEFKKTGRVDLYLKYKNAYVDEKGNEWTALKREELLQDARTTENQTVC